MSHNEKLKRMIDDNKITEAFKMYNEKVENELAKRLTRKPTSAERYADTTLSQCAFVSGAKWMQEEFLKDLWHDVDEIPKRAKAFIFECGDDSMNYHIGMMFNPNDYKKNAETWHMNRWCYLEDILPKKKGDKNE